MANSITNEKPQTTQTLVCAILLKFPQLFKKYADKIEPSFFAPPYHDRLILTLADRFKNSDYVASWPEVMNAIDDYWRKTKLEDVDRLDYQRMVNSCKDELNISEEDGEGKLIDFLERNTFREAQLDALHRLEKGQSIKKVTKEFNSDLKKLDQISGGKFEVVCLADVEREEVYWLWEKRFPLGRLSLIVGNPGTGKSYASLLIATHITTGKPWPNLTAPVEIGNVIILTAEDGIADVVIPRFEDSGGDRSKLFTLAPKRDELGLFNLSTDIAELETIVKKVGNVRLIIIDTISTYLGSSSKVDTNKEKDVRGFLIPLEKFSERNNITIIGIAHINKKTDCEALFRVQGSMAFVGVARNIWLATQDKNEQEIRYLTHLKANYSAFQPDLVFKICGKAEGNESEIKWEDRNVGRHDPDELLAPVQREDKPREIAKRFLKEILKNGPVEVGEIFKRAEEEEINEFTLKRAKYDLGISTFATYGENKKISGWVWKFPGQKLEKEKAN